MKRKITVVFFAAALAPLLSEPLSAGTEFECPAHDCDIMPYFKGEGGFVGNLRSRFDEATFSVACRGVLATSTVSPNRDGLVAQLLTSDNGFACDQEATVEIHGLEYGGWYWITDSRNSAVAYLLSKEVAEEDEPSVEPADPGSPDIVLNASADGYGTLIKQHSTGRIGILPNYRVRSRPETCRPVWSSSRETYVQLYGGEECELGDAETRIILRLESPPSYDLIRIRDGRVTRPALGDVHVAMGLFTNGSGTVTYNGDPPELGWYLSRSTKSYYVNPFVVEVVNRAPGSDNSDALTRAGVEVIDDDISSSDDDGIAWIRISASPTYCTADESHVAKLLIKADPSSSNDVIPEIDEDDDGIAAETTLDILCPPPASANMGRELVPGSAGRPHAGEPK